MSAEPSPPVPGDSATPDSSTAQSEPLPAHPHRKRVEPSPQMVEMQKLMKRFYMAQSPSAWDRSKRKLLQSLSCHMFIGAIIFGVTMYILDHIWWLLLMNGKVLYRFPTNFTTPGSPSTIEIKAPFLSEVQYGEDALSCYSWGVGMLAISGLYAFYTLKASYGSRFIRFFTASILFLVSGFAMIVAPIAGLMTQNSEDEAELLDKDPNYAYDQSVKGSVHYFRDRQCKRIDQVVLGHKATEASEMRAFCTLLVRLIYVYHFMFVTVIIPLLSFIVCWLQIIINRKIWNIKKIRRPKMRTLKQKQADVCVHDYHD